MPAKQKKTEKTKDTQSEPLNFEQSMQTLETLVKQLETGDLPLDDALKMYEQGVRLAGQCQKVLTQAEQKVEILSQIGTEAEVLEPYEMEKESQNNQNPLNNNHSNYNKKNDEPEDDWL